MSYSGVDSEIRWVVSPQEVMVEDPESVFFDVDFYRGKIVPLPQLKEEIFTYFAEHLSRPTSRLAYWNGQRWRHPDGTNYDEVFMQAKVSAKNELIKERFGAEGLGWDRGGKLVDDNLPFLLISLPGPVYRTKYGAKNMTFLIEYIEERNGEKVARVTSIPSREMSAVEHARAVSYVVGEVVETDPNFLVSNPLVAIALLEDIDQISRLDRMAIDLGYKNYSEIEKLAQKSLEVYGDVFSADRRMKMVDFFAAAFHDAQSNVFYSDEKRLIIQTVLSDKMRYYFALEAGSGFLGKTFSEIEENLSLSISDKVRQHEFASTKKTKAQLSSIETKELWEIMERENWRMQIIRSNEKAMDSYRSTGCAISTSMGNGNTWNEIIVDPRDQAQLNSLFGGEVRVGYGSNEGESKELSDGETACYLCPVCESEGHNPAGEVKRKGSELVCQANPEKHHIKYQSQTG